ncbi:branched-chain amino acid ABC transporter permease [Thermomicrobium sp. 4228-Ro]|uniref:branched-chain amino acid ABC transporter permease n=1 Tax=Thermomicrobium sp. 4228-Ro TaxID=2993937 RepID=UPI0022494FDD|nr:branched-chain amino acid ABC transporter permease [Thermomicrobium sp. 4228-Ro]MCX2727992.1 branched-chain amino acid ABC transporter permease [Thermomicrobium sp. 4228-Ro]
MRPRVLGGGLVLLALLSFPTWGSPYFVGRVFTPAFIFGMIALSLCLLAGYGGMVSLAQMTLAGLAGYGYGYLTVTLGQPWWVGVFGGLLVATLVAFLFGVIAVRSTGIYFLMITLALGMVVYALANQNRSLFGGHTGILGIRPPELFGQGLTERVPFYYVSLLVGLLAYAFVRYLSRTPFGLSLQALRDDPRRLAALGFHNALHRVAAFTVAGFLAGLGGLLLVWYNGAISPTTIDLTRLINIMVIAVIGGLAYAEGAFLGALVFILVTNFASSFTQRFNTVIGLVFLLIVLFSPEGLSGIGLQIVRALQRRLQVRLAPVERAGME